MDLSTPFSYSTALRKIVLLALAIVVSLVESLQSMPRRGTTGILEGKIRDKQTKDVLVGVNVVLVGTMYGTMTNAEGMYRINNVRAGVYDVRYSILGYKPILMKAVTILPDLRTRLDIDLEATTIEMEAVEIRAERPLIQKDLAATAFLYGEVKLEKLPVSSFREVLLLQPSTTLEGNVRGGKTNEVTFLVDGLPVQDVIGGGLGTMLPRSSLTELTIQTGGFNPEYGNAMSGVVNVITKSGGTTRFYAARVDRDSWFPSGINRQQHRLSELELTASGPILRDHLFFLTANSYTVSDTRWWQDLEKFFSSPISRDITGFEKLDFFFSPAIKLSLQGIYSLQEWRDYEFSWRFNLSGLPPRQRNSFRTALMFSHTLSDKSFYTSSFNVFYLQSKIGEGAKSSIALQPYDYDFYLQCVTGGQKNWWADTRQTVYTFKGDYTSQIDSKHLLKAGIEINQYTLTSDVLKYEPQMTYYGRPILDKPLLNYSDSYRYGPRSGSVYIQDKIEVERDG